MPPLNAMLGSTLDGFAATEHPKSSPPAELSGKIIGGNPYRRCPLPPFSATVDTIRQFDESGKIPTRRVIPLPFEKAGQGGAVTNITKVTTTPSGSSSGGGGTSSLISATASLSVPALSPGESFMATLPMAKSFQLLLLTATNPVEVRTYGTATAQLGDSPRATDTAVPFEVTANIITDVVFDTAPFIWNWQNRIGANADNPQTTNTYVTVVNPTTSSIGPTNVTFSFLPLES